MTACDFICDESITLNALLRRALGQKIMLDIRYFDDNSPSNNALYNDMLHNCLVGYQPTPADISSQAVEVLPADVANVLADCDIGGVILFSENLVSETQIKRLTTDIQQCARSLNLPMLISIDQEGGRVARLPRHLWPAFTGNMSIGAAQDSRGYAASVGESIGEQLRNLGINVNHAPTVDVNINHSNPVINVRSFGDNPKEVAQLGICMGRGMLHRQVLPTFKHFPGHGDTNIDSHTGLPKVLHDIETIEQVDLYPFQQAIKAQCAPLIMTAHIQYCMLDDSQVLTKTGESIIRPATLSSKILTDLLRGDLGYQGVVITDALDMASISLYFSPLQAIIETFSAGADIALMPFKIHNKAGISAFRDLFEQLVNAVESNESLTKKVLTSYQRIKDLKSTITIKEPMKPRGYDSHLTLQSKLAIDSLVLLKNNDLDLKVAKRIIIVSENVDQSAALAQALIRNIAGHAVEVDCSDHQQAMQYIDSDDMSNTILILAIEDKQSAVTLGGVDDLLAMLEPSLLDKSNLVQQLCLLKAYKDNGLGSIFISFKAPYNMTPYIQACDIAVASFDGSTFSLPNNTVEGPAFDALVSVLMDRTLASATLPINIS